MRLDKISQVKLNEKFPKELTLFKRRGRYYYCTYHAKRNLMFNQTELDSAFRRYKKILASQYRYIKTPYDLDFDGKIE